MEITVKKPSAQEKAYMEGKPTWSCGVSEFDWFYDSQEVCLIIEGEVCVSYGEGKTAEFGAGDYVVFPKGLSCVWKVTKPVKKYYEFK
ncbi:MAG: cupin domain-containing protein [Firmicutes bacterium]|nr:cupin domain-containing protein [Bacillota bacterium]